ncbi:pyrrolysine--tRNA(Pyl) ligase large subunit [Aminipila luticellarii]|uniref:Pyrrolysine--tRNA(Pyl) ligase large subunit n=1 Tax=Aminipila luticellarii TaxID=2507160 RepID=A0A410PWS2_9FIRM|nr:pyrrolysine--tRNA(Pyl) ligase large subunit [Aminipila luticellarii]QAT43389.1 pyrrolysine--tRNA(Pyl) ligase large subunit [Aminipila luticellarii]
MEKFTVTQRERIGELNGTTERMELEFETIEDRDRSFREMETSMVKESRAKIRTLLHEKHVTGTVETGRKLEQWLTGEGFTKVETPTIITKKMLAQMTIDEGHKLNDQVFWLDSKKCLRPMLAPNLYVVMRELKRMTNEPVKIFEIGSCFRKESQGAQHMNEFTMLNCVELAYVEDGQQLEELKRLAHAAMAQLGVPKEEYRLVVEESVVYGSTVDIEINGLEVASGSYGPHFLDSQWGVFDTWVGIGFGIERLTMALSGSKTIKRYGKSISFIDGQPLNI